MSALVFSPLRSKIRENFVDEAPQQYQPVSGVEETWGDRLHILRAQESDSVYTYAATNNMLASSTWEGTVRIWNPETGMCLQTIDHPVLKSNLPIWMVFSIDNKLLATVSPMVDNTEIHVWDPSTGEHLLTLNTKMAGMDSITFLNDNHRLAVIQHRFFTIWDTTTGERWKQIQLFELPKPFLKLNSAVIFQDGRAAVALPRPSAPSEDGSEEYCHPVWLWDSNHDLRILNGHDSRVYSLMFSADGGRLISAAGKTIKLWDSASGACLRTIDTSDPDRHGNCLMAVTQDNRIMWHNFKTLNLWDPATSTTDEIPMTHWRTVRCWADGQRIAAIRPFVVGGRRETIEILDGSVFTPAAKLRYEGLHADSHELYTPADGSVLLSRHNNIQTWQDIFLPWDPETGDCVDIMGAKLYDLRHILSGSNQLLGTNINRDNHGGVVVEVYKLEAVKHLRTFIGSWSTTRINSAAISSDGQKIVLGLYSGEVEVWDMATKTCARRIICTRVGSWQTGVRAVVCSQDDRLLVSASCERVENDKGLVMKVWDQDTSSCVGIVEETTVNANDVFPMAISTDGKILAVRVSRTEITVWHVHRKERLFTVSEFVQEPSTAYFVSTAPLRLQTNLGVWSIPPALLSGENGPVSAKEFEFYGYGVTADCSWIMKGREKIIWIPHDYRGPVVVTGSRVVIGLVKRVLMFHLPVDDVPP